jgi:dipeptidase E
MLQSPQLFANTFIVLWLETILDLMKQLLLISSSRVHGSEFLEHVREAISSHLQSATRLLFVPYALTDHENYLSTVATALEPLGISVEGIHRSADPVAAIKTAEAIFIGGGNSFRLLKTLYDLQLLQPIREAVQGGIPYMGSSAGTNMACPTIRTTNDMPIVEPPSFEALNLIPFQINPHFIDADPNSTHKGETREQRLREYLEDNSVPVVGLREGSWLHVTGEKCVLRGTTGAVLFAPGKTPVEIIPDADLQL